MPELDGVRHELHDVGRVRLHVAQAGDPSAEPLLMLHGWPQHWWTWRKLIGPLAERYRVICPDLRGFGWSEAPARGYRKAELAEDIAALVDDLALDGLKLAGHDWGGMVGFHLCRRLGDRVSHYASAGISHLWVNADEAALTERVALAARLWYQFLIASPLLGRQVVQRVPAFTRAVLERGSAAPDAFRAADLDTFVEQWSEPDRAGACVQIYRTFLGGEFSQIARGAFADEVLPQPIVMLVGELDPVIRAEALTGADANLPRLEVRELAGVGHFVPEEAPERMLDEMLALFARP